jgi:hypothetical protein
MWTPSITSWRVPALAHRADHRDLVARRGQRRRLEPDPAVEGHGQVLDHDSAGRAIPSSSAASSARRASSRPRWPPARARVRQADRRDQRRVPLHRHRAARRHRRTPGAVLIEPEGRNTAPAVLAAALRLAESAPDGLMLVCPSDHASRCRGLPGGGAGRCAAAARGRLVTFGIRPTGPRPATAGSSSRPPPIPGRGRPPAPQPLARFVEKPDAATAAAMLAGGRHLWNSGIFLFSVPAILAPSRPTSRRCSRRCARRSRRRPDLAFLRLDPGRLGRHREPLDRLRGDGEGRQPRRGPLPRRLVRSRLLGRHRPRDGARRERHRPLGPGACDRLREQPAARREPRADPGRHRA